MKHIAVLDIGKTNAKIVLLNAETGKEIAGRRIPNTVLHNGPYPHYDIEMLWNFFIQGLTDFAKVPGFDAISITTHGASVVLLDKNGELAMPMLDYEHEYEAKIRADYALIKPPFEETYSPTLSQGLNVGAQLHYLKTAFPDEFAKVKTILTYPQYWAYRLTGVSCVEVTSLGCHTDLWLPERGTYSSLIKSLELEGKFPELRSAFDAIGTLHTQLGNEIELKLKVPVYCGIHDSNASLLTHLIDRKPPFSVISTGTWVVCFAVGGNLTGLDPKRDTLANVDAYGRVVPSARYMGGREFDMMTQGFSAPTTETSDEVLSLVLERSVMALPSAIPGCGPYPDISLRWLNAETASTEELYVAACLYAGMMTTTCIDLLSSNGPIIVEGPFATNRIYLTALAGFTKREVIAVSSSTGTALGAGILAGAKIPLTENTTYLGQSDLYNNYKHLWKKLSD
ncbi:FGGY-family carbohydrate kinase [Brucella sp. 21LCYQ03]|nr:FGGY-family carbohydrate kinase [Brucella sp. 21LCYQ03]